MSCPGQPDCESDCAWQWCASEEDWRQSGVPQKLRKLNLCEEHSEERKAGMKLSKKIGRAVSRLEARMHVGIAILGVLLGCAGQVETEEPEPSPPPPCEAGVHSCMQDVPVPWLCKDGRDVPIGCTARGPSFCCPEGIEP